MAKPKLSKDQRETLLTWLAAEYEGGLIATWAAERKWPPVSRRALTYYRKRYDIDIELLRKVRRESAINTGLALKEERIARLNAHADALDAIKWEPDEHGRLWNEKAWRETLADIAAETGGRKQALDVTSGGKSLVVDYKIFNLDELLRIKSGESETVVYADALQRLASSQSQR